MMVRGMGAASTAGTVGGAPLNPACYSSSLADVWTCLSSRAADWYTQMEYGAIPQPVGVQPPGAPVTQEQMTVPGAFTPADAIAGSVVNTTAAQDALIAAAQSAGTYNPAGNLPVNASGQVNASALLNWAPWLIGGGVALFLLAKR